MTRETDNFGAFWQSMGIHRASLWTRVIGIMVLVLAAVRLFGSTPYAVDLKLADEAKYLYDGVHLLELGRLDPQWSPLYAIWYFGLMKLLGIHDTVQLFYTSYILLSTLIPLAVFIYLSRLQVRPAIALIAALLVLLSISNLMVFPYPGKAAILTVLVFLILSTLGGQRLRWTLVLIGLVVSSYARPELFTAFLLAIILLTMAVLAKAIKSGKPLPYLRAIVPYVALLAGVTGLLLVVMGNPMAGTRSLLAFRQHFAVNYADWYNLDLDPWTNYLVLYGKVFGEADSIGSAIRSQPDAFLRHVATNALHYGSALIETSFNLYFPNGSLSATAFRIVNLAVPVLVIVATVWALVANAVAARRRVTTCGRLTLPAFCNQPNTDDTRRLAFVTFVIFATTTVSALVIYPRAHYFQLFGVLLIMVVALLASNTQKLLRPPTLSKVPSVLAFVAFGAICLLVTPNIATGFLWAPKPPERLPSEVNPTVQMIRDLKIDSPTAILVAQRWDYGLGSYLDDNFTVLPPTAKQDNFLQFLKFSRPGIVVWPERISEDPLFKEDAEFQQFFAAPQEFGFVQLELPRSFPKVSLLAREDLLPSNSNLVQSETGPPGEPHSTTTAQSTPAAQQDSGTAPPSGEIKAVLAASQALANQGDIAGAEAALREGIDGIEQPASLWLELGKLYATQDRTDEAETAFQQAVRIAPGDPLAHLELATLFENLARRAERAADQSSATKDWTTARDEYSRALDLNPQLVRPYSGLGQYYRATKDWAAAIGIYQQGLAILPEEPWLTMGLAQTYSESGDTESGLPYFEKALQLQPENAFFHTQAGNALSRLQRWDEAIVAYQRALELDPQQYAASYAMGEALEDKGDTATAIEIYRRLLEQAPDSEPGKRAAERLRALGQ